MKEIGGYLELDNLIHNEFYPNLISLNTARNALIYLCRTRLIRKLYIPYYLCDSISKVCEREKIECIYYHIDSNFIPQFKGNLADDEYLYVVNYFGQLSNTYITDLKTKFNNLIIDNVQAFFQKPIENIDTIYSCRKFFGVSDGAYLSTNKLIEEDIEVDISKDRMTHILGRYEGCASDYYSDFKTNDESFRILPLKYMSKLTHNILGALDYEVIEKKRRKNYQCLDSILGELNILHPLKNMTPYMYPFYSQNGISLKKLLVQYKIYVPTLWPNVLKTDNALEKDYAENILPLPCDQRYTELDMKRLANTIKEILNIDKL